MLVMQKATFKINETYYSKNHEMTSLIIFKVRE